MGKSDAVALITNAEAKIANDTHQMRIMPRTYGAAQFVQFVSDRALTSA
jgi:hypothetical protein